MRFVGLNLKGFDTSSDYFNIHNIYIKSRERKEIPSIGSFSWLCYCVWISFLMLAMSQHFVIVIMNSEAHKQIVLIKSSSSANLKHYFVSCVHSTCPSCEITFSFPLNEKGSSRKHSEIMFSFLHLEQRQNCINESWFSDSSFEENFYLTFYEKGKLCIKRWTNKRR